MYHVRNDNNNEPYGFRIKNDSLMRITNEGIIISLSVHFFISFLLLLSIKCHCPLHQVCQRQLLVKNFNKPTELNCIWSFVFDSRFFKKTWVETHQIPWPNWKRLSSGSGSGRDYQFVRTTISFEYSFFLSTLSFIYLHVSLQMAVVFHVVCSCAAVVHLATPSHKASLTSVPVEQCI